MMHFLIIIFASWCVMYALATIGACASYKAPRPIAALPADPTPTSEE